MTARDGDIRRLAAEHAAGLLRRPGLRQAVELARRVVGDQPPQQPGDQMALSSERDRTGV